MKSKILYAIIFVMISLIASASASTNIAYVVRDGTNQNIINFLNENNYKFDVLHERDHLKLVNWSNYSLILVGEGVFSNPQNIPVNKKPSLVLNTKDIDVWGWTKYSSASSLSYNVPPKLWIYQNHYILNKTSDLFIPYDKNGLKIDEFKFYYIKDYAKLNTIIADGKSWLSYLKIYRPKRGAVVATIDEGMVLNKGITAEARGVFFGITNTELWTPDTKKLFENSIIWLIDGNDKDKDGYSVEEGDCDDENPLINPGSPDPLLNCINDAPVLKEEIPNLSWGKGETLEINLNNHFEDPDRDVLNFGIFNTSENENITINFLGNGIIEFESLEGWTGSDWIVFNASDGEFSVNSNRVNLEVTEEAEITEIKINEFVSNPIEGNDWIEIYNSGDLEFNLSLCEIKDGADNILGLSGAVNSKGLAVFEWSNRLNNAGDIIKLYCNGELIDSATYGNWDDGNIGDNAIAPIGGESSGRYPDGKDTDIDKDDFRIFSTPTKGFSNSAVPPITDTIPPIVTLISPANNSNFEDRNVNFIFSVIDNLAVQLYCELFIDNQIKAVKSNTANGTENSLSVNNLNDGNYLWNVRCSDSVNRAFAENNWSFTVDAPNAPILNPIGSKTITENQTLEFMVSGSDPDSDEISFRAENLPIGAVFNSTSRIFSWTPNLTQSGIYSITFIVEDSTGKTDSEIVQITVRNFEEPLEFKNADNCIIFDKNIEVNIKEPDDGDDFKIGEAINIEIEIRNRGDKKVDLDIKTYLYDLDEEEVIESIKDKLKISKNDREKIELEIEIPEDIDTDNDFAIYVIALEDEDEFCNSNHIKIEIKRPKERVKIKSVIITPERVSKGGTAEVRVRVQNIGEDSTDVSISVENSELEINEKTEEFELEEYKKDDTATKIILIKIPEDAEEKTYELDVIADYNGESEQKTANLIVGKESIDEDEEGVATVVTGGLINLDKSTPADLGAKEISEKMKTEEITKIKVDVGKQPERIKSETKVIQFVVDYDYLVILALLILILSVVILIVSVQLDEKHKKH